VEGAEYGRAGVRMGTLNSETHRNSASASAPEKGETHLRTKSRPDEIKLGNGGEL